MLTVEESDSLRPTVRVCKIICIAMILGVLFFMSVAIAVGPVLSGPMPPAGGKGPSNGAPVVGGLDDFEGMLTWTAVAFAAVSLPFSIVLPRLVAARSRRALAAAPKGPEADRSEALRLAPLYVSQFIIGAALCEGAAFFALAVYLLGGRWIALAAAVVMIVAIAARFPTRDRVEGRIERERENLFRSRHALG